MANKGGAPKKCVIGEDGSLCWYCKTTTCEWHTAFEPVPGWNAEPYKLKLQQNRLPHTSYHVIECPKFERGTKGINTEDSGLIYNFMKAVGANCVKEYMSALRYLHRFDGVPYESLIDSQRQRYNELAREIEHEEAFILASDTFFGMRSKDVIEMIKRRVFDE